MAWKVGVFDAHIIGSFIFEQQTGKLTIVASSDAHLSLQLGVVNFSITGINGAFVFYSGTTSTNGTMAIKLEHIGAITVTGIPQVYFSVENFFLEINNTGLHVQEHLVFGDNTSLDIDFATDRTVLGGTAILGIGGRDAVNNAMLQLMPVGVTIDTGATGNDLLFSALSLSGTTRPWRPSAAPSRSTPTISGSRPAGHLVNYDDPATTSVVEKFGVEVFFGGTYKEAVMGPGPDGILGTADDVVTGTTDTTYAGAAAPTGNFQWPSWLPLKLRYIALEWDDVGAHPEDFNLTITASITVNIPGLTVAGYVENMVIDVGDLVAGKFPIKSFDAAALYVSGTMFGMTVSGGFVLGMIPVDATNHEVLDPTHHPLDVDHTLFYAGLSLSVNIAGIGEAQFWPLAWPRSAATSSRSKPCWVYPPRS